jgi:probable O-glycosylation ligase (exosortase A-associated)
VSLVRPWVGVIASYVFVILTPQAIWWWAFRDIRPAYWIVLATMVGFAFAVVRREIDFSTLSSKRTWYVLILWAAYNLSYYFGPYVDVGGPYRFTDPGWAASTINKIIVLYFLACLCIDDMRKLKALTYVIIGSGIYMIYWANDMYLSGRGYGRLAGPMNLDGRGLYSDQNNFAMLFVVVLPFIWYMGLLLKSRILRIGLWLVIPFGWHAIFLTGSRGGLVGIAATLMIMVWRSKHRTLAALLLPAFAIAYFWQAGDLMRDRAGTLTQVSTEASAVGRLQAWGAAASMIANHPITGVGLASFGPAFPDYSEHKPREAHNTFFQITAESGLIAGSMYVMLAITCFFSMLRNGTFLKRNMSTREDETLYLINEALLVSFSGLLVCSLFLSLQLFEIFYCLAVMMNAILYITAKRFAASEPVPGRRTGNNWKVQRSRGVH